MKNQYDEKIRMADEEVEEILNEKNTLESTYKKWVYAVFSNFLCQKSKTLP